MKPYALLFVIAVSVTIFTAGGVVFGQSNTQQVRLQFSPKCVLENALGECPEEEEGNISHYIVRLYRFGIVVAGILAVGAIIVGAIYRIVSMGTDRQKEGSEIIKQAIWGIVILLGAALIFNTINPRIANLVPPGFKGIFVKPLQTFYLEEQAPPGEEAKDLSADELAKISPAIKQACETIGVPDRVADCIRRSGYFKSTDINKCADCVSFTDRTNIKSKKTNTCTWRAGISGECSVHKKTFLALERLNAALFGEDIGIRVTEAFPPLASHQSSGHYNGCSIDVAVHRIQVNPATKEPLRDASGAFLLKALPGDPCKAISEAIKKLRGAGFSIYNEYEECPITLSPGVTSCHQKNACINASHLHITTVSCP